MKDAKENFNNFNDNFRAFISYANKLHRLGELDFIIITGDIVDYIFENKFEEINVFGHNVGIPVSDMTYNSNNFVYFENIVKGLSGKPDMVRNEELKVPIFTSLGNHDYRVAAYFPITRVGEEGVVLKTIY